MRHSAAHHAALALCALLLAAALLFAWSGSSAPVAGGAPEGDGAAGAEPFEAHCAGCHDLEDLVAPYTGEGAAAAVLELLELLEEHGAATPAEDRAIAARLLEAARGGE